VGEEVVDPQGGRALERVAGGLDLELPLQSQEVLGQPIAQLLPDHPLEDRVPALGDLLDRPHAGVLTIRWTPIGVRGMTRTSFEEAVAAVLAGLGPGDVVTYGEVAAEAGRPGAARAVGRFLADRGDDQPWWRVVTSTGRLVPGHEREHARRLRAEGVAVRDGRVILR
jgi:methylated-DNA-protein-cysteine methyltransferase-like protein